jgi:hypothetical protein
MSPQWLPFSTRLAACFSPGVALITVFKSQMFRKQRIVNERERWDEEWREVGRRNGWQLPPPVTWPLRIWGIRYVRAAAASVRLIRQIQRSSSHEIQDQSSPCYHVLARVLPRQTYEAFDKHADTSLGNVCT